MNGSHSRHEWAKNDAMSVRRNRLHDMTIDEVSLVDRAANQLANIAFSKAANQEDDMPEQLELFDEDGFPVDTDSLDINDVVYDMDGNPGVIVPDDEFEDEYDEDLEPVGKAGFASGLMGMADNTSRGARGYRAGAAARRRGLSAKRKATGSRGRAVNNLNQLENSGRRVVPAGMNVDNPSFNSRLTRAGMQYRAAPTTGALAVGGGLGAGGVGGAWAVNEHKRNNVGKSLGDAVLEELSKAASEDERSEIIAAAMQEVEIAKAQAEQAMAYAEQAQDEQLEIAFISKAAEYNLPVSPEVLGPILKSAATVLSDEQLDVLDQLFSGIGEYLYEELGVVGDTDNSDVYSQVDLAARELVGKADGTISAEQATTMMFETNPAAYEQYLAENGR